MEQHKAVDGLWDLIHHYDKEQLPDPDPLLFSDLENKVYDPYIQPTETNSEWVGLRWGPSEEIIFEGSL